MGWLTFCVGNMNLWTLADLLLAVCYLPFGILFAALKGKASILISGFNSLSKSERMKYNTDCMSRDMAVLYFRCSAVLFAGGVAAQWVHGALGFAAFVISLILMFKDIHWDIKKGIEKYLIDDKMQ